MRERKKDNERDRERGVKRNRWRVRNRAG
jgi:hypothetical protein